MGQCGDRKRQRARPVILLILAVLFFLIGAVCILTRHRWLIDDKPAPDAAWASGLLFIIGAVVTVFFSSPIPATK